MFLKSLEIYGFKSFADRTHINFADGITALLGPNGCGKSNVVDAIKWVLAENKSKNLRASSMEDVIFNGTGSRPALSVAEVTLTIANENSLLPVEDTEIAIKRRLYKSGENEYFLNGKQVTATEIRKLFMDTGVGKAAYSVMEQGKIDQILSSKPEDRRYLFEEAAGISRSKAEVQEAQRNIERTKANLAQIESVLAETKRNYETLKVQSDKTSKYRKYLDEKFNYELDIQLLRLKEFTQTQARTQASREEILQKRDSLSVEIEELRNTLSENSDRLKALNDQIVEKQKEQLQIATEQNGKKENLRQIKQRQLESKSKLDNLQSKLRFIEEQIESYEEEIDEKTADLYSLQKQLEEMKERIKTFSENITLSNGKIKINEDMMEANVAKVHDLEKQRNQLQQSLASITEDIVGELDAKLKSAGYSSQANKKAKEELTTSIEKLKIFANGRANIFNDFASLSSHSEKDAQKFSTDAVQAFHDVLKMIEEVQNGIDNYAKTMPEFIDDFLSPEGIITKKRSIDTAISDNIAQVDSIREQNNALAAENDDLEEKVRDYQTTLNNLRISESGMSEKVTSASSKISDVRKLLAEKQSEKKSHEEEIFEENRRNEEINDEIAETEELIAELEMRGVKLTNELNAIDKEIEQCSKSENGKKATLSKKNEELGKLQQKFEQFNFDIGQIEVEIRNVKQNFQDNYSRDLMEFEERMYTITSTTPQIREKLSATKQKIQELGQVNLMAVEQFAEEKERYERQLESYNDTNKALSDLTRVYDEIKTNSTQKFCDTYNMIRRNFHNMFRRLMNGGTAELRLVDPSNPLTTGIEIFAQPPGKKLVNISLLSGGEKTMTAVALLFATYQVRPSPFCLLDEIDAALDDKNVASFVNTLRAFGNKSQYIVITHNRKTVMGASSMLGVTMEESGITKVVQIRLDEEMLNGNASFDDQSDFIEEDVPPEEGIVIPPRPAPREHNPDGSLKISEADVSEKVFEAQDPIEENQSEENAVTIQDSEVSKEEE